MQKSFRLYPWVPLHPILASLRRRKNNNETPHVVDHTLHSLGRLSCTCRLPCCTADAHTCSADTDAGAAHCHTGTTDAYSGTANAHTAAVGWEVGDLG